jgi:hypothetical protein
MSASADRSSKAAGRLKLTVFSGLSTLIEQSLHWSPSSTLAGVSQLPPRIEHRLIDAEVSEEALALWTTLLGQSDQEG